MSRNKQNEVKVICQVGDFFHLLVGGTKSCHLTCICHFAVLVPLLEKLLRIVVELNVQSANDASCFGDQVELQPQRCVLAKKS